MTWLRAQIDRFRTDKLVDEDPRTTAWLMARLVECESFLQATTGIVEGAGALAARIAEGPLHDRDYTLDEEEAACYPFSAYDPEGHGND